MSDEGYDWNSIGTYAGGGALTGAAISALYNYIKNTKQLSKDIGEDTSADDDVLYIKGKKKRTKQASELFPPHAEPNIELGNDSTDQKMLQLIAGTVGGIAGYKGIKSLYKHIQNKQLQEELDDAQVAYMTNLQQKRDTDAKKYASLEKAAEVGSGSPMSSGMVLPASALLLLALASGVMSYRTLDQTFPGRKRKGVVQGKKMPVGGKDLKVSPQKIKVLGKGNKVVKTMDADGGPTEADKIESMVRSASADPDVCKQAGFDDLFSALRDGRANEIKSNLQYGINHVFDTIKGASAKPVTDSQKNMAVGFLVRDPMLKEAFTPLFASEYANMTPSIYKAASNLSEEEQDLLADIGGAFNVEYRQVNFPDQEPNFEKGASAILSGMNIMADVNEGTTFFASGNDSDEDEDESEEAPGEETDNDQIDGFFNKSMAPSKV